MINVDVYVIGFVKDNIFTLSLALGALKILAKSTKWVWDDQISTLLSGVFNQVRGKPPVAVPPLSERGQEVK
jgi:hypothetical protein